MRLAIHALALMALSGGVANVAHAQPPKPVAQVTPGVPKPSGVLKAYKGPEGEIVAMLEVNDSKEMLVYFKNLGGDLEGKAVLYLFEDLGHGDKNVYINKKRGSKTYRSNLLSARDNNWSLYHPTKPNTELQLSYSEKESGELKIDDVLKAYKP